MGKKINLFLLTIFFVLFSLSTLVLAVDCPVPDTGQTKCYDNDSEITCPQPGEPFYGQDAQHPCNPQSYTTLSGGIMVQDNVTGLVWENKTDDSSIHDKDNTYTWQNAQDVFIATLNSQNFGGYSDWRLPTVNELASIVDRGKYFPSIDTTYFPNTMSDYYWSSNTLTFYTYYAWSTHFFAGGVNNIDKLLNQYVRAVRGGQSSTSFIDNGDGTITDIVTGLMWQKDTAMGTYTWEQALSYCEDLTLAEHDDWRLPNINELQSLVDYGRNFPSIDTTYFPNTMSDYYWSSTTIPLYPYQDLNHAWSVLFIHGNVGEHNKSVSNPNVRAVRGGQCGSLDTSTTTIVASTTSTIQPCPTEQLYGEHSEETETLRYFRDNIMSQTPEGQEIIKLYYEWSPTIVKAMEEDETIKEQVKEMIDISLKLIKVEDN